MNTVNRPHGWLRWIGSGVGVVVFGVSLYGAPPDGPSRTGRDRVDLGDHVLVHPTAHTMAASSRPWSAPRHVRSNPRTRRALCAFAPKNRE